MAMDYAKSAVLSIQGIKNIKVKMEDYCMVSRVYPEDADYDGNFDIVCYQNHAGNFSHMLTIYTDNGIYKTITGPRDKERNWLVGSYNVNTLSAQVIGGTL